MISIKTLPINAWQKRFAYLPVTFTEQLDQTNVKQTKIWFDHYWQRVSINKSDRSLKTTVLTETDYKRLWVMETLPHVVARSTLVNDLPKDVIELSQNFVDYTDGKIDGREEFAGIYPILEKMNTIYGKYLDSGLIGEEVIVRDSGQDYKEFEYSQLMNVMESVELPNEFERAEVLDALLSTRYFKEGNYKHKVDYLRSLNNDGCLNFVVVRRTQERTVEILNRKNKTVELSISLVKAQ